MRTFWAPSIMEQNLALLYGWRGKISLQYCTPATGDTCLHFAIRGSKDYEKDRRGFEIAPQRKESRKVLIEELLEPLSESQTMSILKCRNRSRNTALMEAAMAGDLDVFKLLCYIKGNLKSESNRRLETLLHFAARFDRHEILLFVLQNCEPDVNARTSTGTNTINFFRCTLLCRERQKHKLQFSVLYICIIQTNRAWSRFKFLKCKVTNYSTTASTSWNCW